LDEISLETMDGYKFQKFVANLFQKLGFSNVKVGPAGADEIKDKLGIPEFQI
jgi:hypothetical protein